MTGPDVATHPDQRIRELRHEGVRRSVGLLREGDFPGALACLLASVEAQARQAGCGRVSLTPHQ